MSSVFSRIASGEIPSHRVAETADHVAFLDHAPLRPGHTLVIPRVEVDKLYDLDDEILGGLMVFAKRVARALETAVPCGRVGFAVAGLEVPHAHIHLIPMRTEADLTFRGRTHPSDEELAAMAERIRNAIV